MIEAIALIRDADKKYSAVAVEIDLCRFNTGMAHDVGQRLLDDAKGSGGNWLRQRRYRLAIELYL